MLEDPADRQFLRQHYTHLFGPTLAPTVLLGLCLARRPTKTITLKCLIDSGADQSIISFEIAEALGLKRKHAVIERAGGLGGDFNILAFPQEDFIGSVGDGVVAHKFSMNPRFHEPGVKAMQVLGRLDFFRGFHHIEFHERSKYVDLYF